MLIRDGYDPTTTEYYDELDARVARRMPHRAGNGEDDPEQQQQQQQQTPGPKFRVGGQERPLKANEVHINRERREAMEEAGVWEDPVLRKKYLNSFRKWDQENPQE